MFITFEGIEGCGKSTQAKRLFRRLQDLEIPSILTQEPGGTRLGQDIRKILLNPRNRSMLPLAELFLYAADRAQHVADIIKPALAQEKWVVCDRFFDATIAYQGHARKQDISFIKALNEKASMEIRPDLTFLIDCPVSVGLERAIKRNQSQSQSNQDRFEREDVEFHEAVRKGYLSLAEADDRRFFVADGTLNEEKLESMLFDRIRPLLPNYSH